MPLWEVYQHYILVFVSIHNLNQDTLQNTPRKFPLTDTRGAAIYTQNAPCIL